MNWRESMGVKNIKSQEQKPQKEQKPLNQPPFATFAPFAPIDSKIKKDHAPAPDLSKAMPEDIQGQAPAPDISRIHQDHARMTALERKIKANPPTPGEKTPPGNTCCPVVGTPSPGQAIEPDPTIQGTKTCRACGQSQWWRKNEPNSKWICCRCHRPAPGLDVIYDEI